MNILIIGPSWIGDMVMAQSLFKKCKADHPNSLIDVVSPAWSQPILSRMPEVRNTILLPTGHGQLKFFKRWKIGNSLKSNGYERAIVLPRTWKSALIPYFAEIPKRTGFLGEFRYGLLNDIRKLDKKILDRFVLRYLALGQEKNDPLPPINIYFPEFTIDQDNQNRLISEFHLRLDRPAVCFFPGAEFGPAKQWPISYFRQLAEDLVKSGYQIWVMGSSKEFNLGEKITQSGAPHHINLCGKTRLEDAIDLMALAVHAVSNDSGLMHVAAAVGLKMDVLYGSSSPSYTPPLSHSARIHYLGLNCSPCFKRTCPLGHLNCLKLITPQQLYQSVVKGCE